MDEKKVESIIFGLKETIAEKDKEIERLTEENEHLDGCAKQFLADYQKCEIERVELQKQVDELKLDLENWKKAAYGYKYAEEQAVKKTVNDMGKEIYKRVTDNLKMWLRERFDVEVEDE